MPPSLKVLRERLSGRGTESAEQVEGRLKSALEEIARAGEYDYIITNGQLETAVEDVITVIKADRLSICRRRGIIDEILAKANNERN